MKRERWVEVAFEINVRIETKKWQPEYRRMTLSHIDWRTVRARALMEGNTDPFIQTRPGGSILHK